MNKTYNSSQERIETGKVECYCDGFNIKPHSHIMTDNVSSNIRPDLPVIHDVAAYVKNKVERKKLV